MSQRFSNPKPQFTNSAGLPYSGGVLRFYATNSSTPLAVYSDAGLSVSLGTSITLNSAGAPTTSCFLQNVDYKVTLEDSDSNIIWSVDPVRASDFASFPITKVGSGTPNGNVAGTAGSSGVLPTMYFDYASATLYVCTSTGTISTAVWTAINASSATTTPILTPQGRLTLTSATPVMTTETVAATSVFYTPRNGNLIPIYNGSAFVNSIFTEALTTLVLSASHALNTIYDVFVFLNSGVVTIGTGPAWNSSAAGSGSRGASADLARLNGILTNAQSITARNGATTYTVAGNYGTYVGSILIDGTAGQITCHNTYGQSRKWGVWNAYDRQPIVLQMGDTTATWAYSTNTIRQSNAAAGNTVAAFCGLAEEVIEIAFGQIVNSTAGAAWGAIIGVGVDSTTAISGRRGKHVNGLLGAPYVTPPLLATHVVSSLLGLSNLNALESGNGTAGSTFVGANADMLFTVRYRG